jgi:hypothetical protein
MAAGSVEVLRLFGTLKGRAEIDSAQVDKKL